MKRLKTVSLLIDLFKVRPIVLAAGFVLICDIIYVNLFYKWPTPPKQEYTTIKGTVRDKTLDEDDLIYSILVGDTLCYVNKVNGLPDISIGDKVTVTGNAYVYTGAMNFGEFDAKKYNASQRIFYYIYAKDIAVVRERSFSVKEAALKLRHFGASRVSAFCPLEGGTVNTLLLADKRTLDKDRKNLYTEAGVGHFLVISGLHISAIGAFVYKALRSLGIKRRNACVAAILLLTGYGCIVGFSVSVIRAVIMYAVRLLADMCKRVYDMLNSLAIAVIVSILINPLCILDYGFVYSYMTVFSIAFYYTFLNPGLKSCVTVKDRLKEFFRIPVILCIFQMPVNLYLSYRYSLASILINAVLAPFSGIIILLAGLSFGASLMGIGPIASFFDFLLAVILRALDSLCRAGTALKGLSFTGKPSIIVVLAYYFLLLLFYAVLKDNMNMRLRVAYILTILLFAGRPYFITPRLSMLYVGQGECMILRTSDTGAVMIDCGSSSEKNISQYKIAPFLKASGITTLKGVIITHTDTDHVSGLLEMLDDNNGTGAEIKHIFLPDIKEKDENYQKTVTAAAKLSIPVSYLDRGEGLHNNNYTFTVLSPDKKNLSGDINEDSLVMLMDVKGIKILFTGDSSKRTEENYISELPKRADVLKVAHHGSESGTSEELLKKCSFDMAIISAGIDNRYGHPHKETIERLRVADLKYACTKDEGEIDIVLRGRGRCMAKYYLKDN